MEDLQKIYELPEVGFKLTYKARKPAEQSAEELLDELNGESENGN